MGDQPRASGLQTSGADPTWDRLEDQVDWYDRKSVAAQQAYKRVKLVQLVIGAAVPVAALQAPAAVTAVLAAIVVVAEGAIPEGGAELLATAEVDAFGHKRLGGVGNWLADEIARRTGAESRAVVLGHIQRGGTPTAYDRVLATRFGVHAVDAVHEGDGGVMVSLRGTDIVRVKLAEATAAVKTVPLDRHAEAEVFFG